MTELDNDIKIGLEILKGNLVDHKTLKTFSSTYFNTNEFIPESLKLFQTGDNWLTVLASGDQTFYAVLNGAKKIDTFDVNKFCFYFFELKRAAILELSQPEFIDFFPVVHKEVFSNEKNNYFSSLIYKKIRGNLTEDTKRFWDTMFFIGNFQYFNINLRKSLLILANRESEYFSSYNYPILKSRLKEAQIKFYHTSLYSLPTEIKLQKYDTIWCSNIHDYSAMNCQKYIDFLEENIKPILSHIGTCMAYYSLNPYSKSLDSNYFIKKSVFIDRTKKATLSLTKK